MKSQKTKKQPKIKFEPNKDDLEITRDDIVIACAMLGFFPKLAPIIPQSPDNAVSKLKK